MFRDAGQFSEAVKVTKLIGWLDPVSWTDTSGLPPSFDSVIGALTSFPDIRDVSIALRLNFWQHVVFETYARHLLYKYTIDIEDSEGTTSSSTSASRQRYSRGGSERSRPRPIDIPAQLIGYVGGEAGSGKSKVISALLTFARLWGRRDTVETMAFMQWALLAYISRATLCITNAGLT